MDRVVIAHLDDCEDGKCATFFRDQDGNVWVRGLLPDGTETDVMIKGDEFAYLVSQLPR